MIQDRVRLKKRIFSAPDSGFAVFQAQFAENTDCRVIVGFLIGVQEGDLLEIEGEEVLHPRFGLQVKVGRFEIVPPSDETGVIRFLSSGRIKGIGKKTAEKIVRHLGVSALEILEKDPQALQKVPGIRKDVRENIHRLFLENRVIRDLAVKLSPYGLGAQTVAKIYDTFQESSLEIISRDPYLLIDRIRGISFRIADRIGRAMGIGEGDPSRIRAALLFMLEQAESQSGDLCLAERDWLSRSSRLLNLDVEELAEQVPRLEEDSLIVREEVKEETWVALSRNSFYEAEIARRLGELRDQGPVTPAPVIHFANLFERLDVELSQEQRDAVVSAVGEKVVIITGGPGTGKTTIIRALIEVFHDNRREVALAAPTGRAAKRIEESGGIPASTIHRLLKINPQTGRFVHDRSQPLRCDVVIIDEFSMVDTFLFHSLLQAMPDRAQLVIIGDKDQLPSVGPGNVLRDLIASQVFPVIALSRNFRQEETGLIVENAYRVIRGELPLFAAYRDDLDFVLLSVNSEAEAVQKVESIYRFYLDTYGHGSQKFQILIPMYRGEAGIDGVNRRIQETFNPGPALIANERMEIRRSDKIMQIRNNYEKEVFNGDLGAAIGYDTTDRLLIAEFDGRPVDYLSEELDELALAYAVSIHKSQGSEYDIVVVVLLPNHAVMFSRELLYTAITRAKKRLILVSDKKTILRACRNSRPQMRRTMLPHRLEERFPAGA